ncbi:MAG: hypothetical protein DRP85_07060 [Candidatus Makaraimicrobium thalassicum]|nr:MAG: hypothetical protein DRP85_07060 [Candidatus Omnitrophota bacterium]
MLITSVLGFSALLQFAAALLALNTTRKARNRAAWAFITVVLFLMAFRRSITLFHLLSGRLTYVSDLPAELVALATSMFILAMVVVWALACKRHVAEYTEAEEKLREMQRYTRELIEVNLDPLATISCEGRIMDVNHAMELAVGRSRGEIIGTDFSGYFTDPETARRGYQKVLQDNYVRDYPLEIRSSRGKTIPVLYNASVYKDTRGQVAGVFAAARDITERREAEAEIRRCSERLEAQVRERTMELTKVNKQLRREIAERKNAEKKIQETMEIKSEFVSLVSHELRTPLTSIKEGISIVLSGIAGKLGGDQKKFLDIAKRNVDRLARLINDVLDFQKLEAGRVEFNMAENDINELVEEVYSAMLPLTDDKGLDFAVRTGDDLPRAKFDKDKITQVLTNIVSNAVKFTEKGGITVATAMEDAGAIRVSVKDTGPGVRLKDISRLFHKFEQLARGGDRITGGSGLGLAISREIIEKHGGKIWAESEVGKGTTFHFILPLDQRK